MSTYLQGVTDTNAPTPFLSLDYNFLQQQESRANEQYQSGLNEVKSDYSAVVNAPVTGPMAQKVKEQYLQDAQQKLKKLSASDLSLPQNVQQAEAAFAPFWKDELLLRNTSFTRQNNALESQYNNDLNSKDKDIRAGANPLMLEAIQYSRKELADLPWEQGAYQSYTPRTYTRFDDLNAKAAAEFDKLKLKGVTTTTSDGTTLVETVNGPMSKEAFTTFWLGMNAGPEHDEQFRVSAYVDYRRKVEALKSTGIDEQQARAMIGQDYVGQLNESYKDQLATYVKMAKDAGDSYKNFKPLNPDNLTEQEAAKIQQYTAQEKAYLEKVNEIEDKYSRDLGYVRSNVANATPGTGSVDENSLAYKRMQGIMATRPLDYLSDILKHQQAANWGAAVASISGEKMSLNPLFKEKMENDIKWAGIKNAADRNAITAEHYNNEDYDRAYKISPEYAKALYGESAEVNYNQWKASGGTRNKGIVDVSSGDVQREDPTLISKQPTSLDVLQAKVDSLHGQLVGGTYSTNGLTGTVLTKTVLGTESGLDANQIAILNRWSQHGYQGKGTTKEEEAVLDKVKSALSSNGIDVSSIKGPDTLMPALSQLSTVVMKKLIDTHDPADMQKVVQLHAINANLVTTLQTYNTTSSNFHNAVEKEIISNPEYKTLVNPGDPKRGIAPHQWTVDEMAPYFPTITIDNNGKEEVLKPRQVADLYNKGDFRIERLDGENPSVLLHGDHRVHVIGVNGVKNGGVVNWLPDINPQVGQMFRQYFKGTDSIAKVDKLPETSILGKFGESGQRAELLRNAGKKVADGMKEFDTGIIGSSLSFDLTDTDNKNQQKTGTALAKEVGFAGNQDVVYTRNDNGSPDDPWNSKDTEALNSLLRGAKNIEDVFSSIEYEPVGPSGKRSAKLTFQPTAEGKKMINGTKLSDLTANSTVYIDLKDDASGTLINSIGSTPDIFINGGLLTDDKTVVSDDLENSMGFQYTITPGPKGEDGRNTSVTLGITLNKVDPETGEFVKDAQGNILTEPEHIVTIPLMRGEGAMNPDELKNTIYKMQNAYLVNMSNIKTNYANTHQGTRGTGMSYAEVIKRAQAQYKGN